MSNSSPHETGMFIAMACSWNSLLMTGSGDLANLKKDINPGEQEISRDKYLHEIILSNNNKKIISKVLKRAILLLPIGQIEEETGFMYLASVRQGGKLKYVIRKSFFDDKLDCYNYRPVFDLGSDPTIYIKYSGDVVFFEESLDDAVSHECGGDSTLILEDLLWQYLSADERQRISLFRRSSYKSITSLTTEERKEIEQSVHLFDRRRLYYIRYGAVDQGRIFRLDDRIYRPLLHKCRDEKEYYFKELEAVLQPDEYKTYNYAIFDIQRKFSEISSSFMPEALDQSKVEAFFEEEICRINSDRRFWQSEEPQYFLHHHLHRYVVQFFDFGYEHRSFEAEFYRNFRNSHRKFRWPERKAPLSEEETIEIFGEEIGVLKKMKKEELTRIFRKKAKEFHPDSGGEHEKFIRLLSAFDELKKNLKK